MALTTLVQQPALGLRLHLLFAGCYYQGLRSESHVLLAGQARLSILAIVTVATVPTSRRATVAAASTFSAVGQQNSFSVDIGASCSKSKENGSSLVIRSLNCENESAQILSQSGFNVEQNPYVAGNKNPDYRINGEVFDNYAPKSNSVRNIYSEVKNKITSGQTTNVVINMSYTKISLPTLQNQFSQWPIMGLDKVIVIDKTGNAVRIK